MEKHTPVILLELLEFWLNNSWSCVKWADAYSPCLKVCFGVRQDFVLSPYLFALYLDDLIDGRTNGRTSFVIMYADDILILSSTLTELQNLLRECDKELTWLDMSINIKSRIVCTFVIVLIPSFVQLQHYMVTHYNGLMNLNT